MQTLSPLDAIEDVGGKDGAFEADGGVHGDYKELAGISTYMPRTSMGRTG